MRSRLFFGSLFCVGLACAPLCWAADDSESDKSGSQDATEPGTIKVNSKDQLEYVWIPPGGFEMGCVPGDPECHSDEAPRHGVVISKGFWMGRTEVPWKAYRLYAKKARKKMPPKARETKFGSLSNSRLAISGRFKPGPGKKEDRPIVNVTWAEARGYCRWAGGRLPSEAAWEYAARGGKDGLVYPWGDELTHENANYGNVGGRDQWHYTAPAGSFEANGFGLFDMAGNVWEWCADWVDGNYYLDAPEQDPAGPETGEDRVARGGSWSFPPRYLRVSTRLRAKPDGRAEDFGFRCVLDRMP